MQNYVYLMCRLAKCMYTETVDSSRYTIHLHLDANLTLIDMKTRLQNDLYCVEWDVKLYHSIPMDVKISDDHDYHVWHTSNEHWMT